MVEHELVKKQIRKRIALIGGAVATVGLVILIIVAFLGQHVGSFTVGYNTKGKAEISLYDNHELKNPTTYLKIGDIPQMTVYSSIRITEHAKIDSDETDYLYGSKRDAEGNVKFLYYLKYTFYVQNTGDVVVDYTFQIKITENLKPTNTDYYLLDLLRVRLYDNMDDLHEYETYAKKSLNKRIDEKGQETYCKPVAGELGTAAYDGFSTSFESDEVVTTFNKEVFEPQAVHRYTVVFWLEGEDEYCHGEQPENGSIKLGVDISGYVRD